MSTKKIKITTEQYNKCMCCVWRDRNVEGVVKCSRVKCKYEVKK